MMHLLVKIPAREHFRVPSKQWAWLDEISGGLLLEAVTRGLDVFGEDPKKSPLWVLAPRVGPLQVVVLCSDAEGLASEEMKQLLNRHTNWHFVGEWRSEELEYLATNVTKLERWTGMA